MSDGSKKIAKLGMAGVVALAFVILIAGIAMMNYSEQSNKLYIEQQEEEASRLRSEGDFESAVKIYLALGAEEYKVPMDEELLKEYEQSVCDQVESLLKKSDFEGALAKYAAAAELLGSTGTGRMKTESEALRKDYRSYVNPTIELKPLRTLHPGDSLTTGTVEAYASYGSFGSDKLTDYQLSAQTVSESGSQPVIVTWQGDDYNSSIAVGAACTKLELTCDRDRVYLDEELQAGEFTVKATFEDGTTETYSVAGNEDILSLTDYSVSRLGKMTVNVKGWSVSGKMTIEVIERPYVTGITAEYAGNIIIGETVNREKLTVRKVFSDKSEKEIDDYTVDTTTAYKSAGTKKVKVKWTDSNGEIYSKTISIEVVNAPVSMTIKFKGATPLVGDEITPSQLTVKLKMADGTSETIKDYTLSVNAGKNAIKLGDNTIVCTYGDVTGSLVIKGKKISEIDAEYKGTKPAVGDAINKDDIKVTAYYTDGTSEAVTDWTMNRTTISKIGTNSVIITYRTSTTTIGITGVKRENDSFDRATPLTTEFEAKTFTGINCTYYYSLTLNATSKVDLAIDSNVSGLRVMICNDDRAVIWDTELLFGNTSINFTRTGELYLEKGFYYVSVAPKDIASAAGTYKIAYTATSAKVNYTEGNNGFDTAAKLTVNKTYYGQSSYVTSSEIDKLTAAPEYFYLTDLGGVTDARILMRPGNKSDYLFTACIEDDGEMIEVFEWYIYGENYKNGKDSEFTFNAFLGDMMPVYIVITPLVDDEGGGQFTLKIMTK